MKCQVFELVVVDLARGSATIDDRGEALEHAEGCERCCARLASERALSTELRALAAADAGVRAPERVEANLRAAFHSLAAPVAVAPRRSRVAPFAIAAGVATLLGGALAYRAAVAPKEAPRHAEPPRAAGVEPPAPPRAAGNIASPVAGGPREAGARESGIRKASRAVSIPRAASTSRDAESREVTTAYYSLVGGEEVVPRDGWQIVRVEVPRASLGALGFAVNPARADEPITADVMLGHDGVARAIRFVQTTDPAERSNR